MNMNPNIVGIWTYRSHLNNSDNLPKDAKVEELFGRFLLAQAELEFFDAPFGQLVGILRMGLEFNMDIDLDITGSIEFGNPFRLNFRGVGRQSTVTNGWIYDYIGYWVPAWPNGVNQRDAFVGSVIRTVPHDGQPAGEVASFIAVKKVSS